MWTHFKDSLLSKWVVVLKTYTIMDWLKIVWNVEISHWRVIFIKIKIEKMDYNHIVYLVEHNIVMKIDRKQENFF